MATPDVRVRLTAEGVAEVVAALHKIRQESEAAAKNGSKAFGGLNTILQQSQRLFGTLGVAVGAGAIVALARNAANAADELGETAEAIGTNTTRLSALSTISEQAGLKVAQLRQGLGLTADKIRELRDGNEQVADSFAKLGLRAEDFAGKDTAEAFDLIASKLGPMETGLKKTGIAADLFGTRIGPRLIPLLNQLADGGLAKAEKSARELGTVLDEEVVAAAGRVSDETNVLGQQLNAMATVLVAELQPAFSDTFQIAGEGLKDLAEGVSANSDGLRALAGLVNLVLLLAVSSVDAVVSAVRELFTLIGGAAAVAVTVLSGNAERAKFVWGRTLDQMQGQLDEFKARNARQSAEFDAILSGRPLRPPTLPREQQPGAGAGDGDGGAAARKKLAEQAQLERALLDNALKLRQAGRRAEEAEAKAAFDRGLTSLEDYYAKRRAIAEKGAADETAALKARAAIEERLNTNPASRATALANIAGEIERGAIDAQRERAALIEEERQARERLNTQRLGFEEKILSAQGKTHEAAMANIEAEAREFERTIEALGGLAQTGFTPEDLRAALEASAEFDRRVSEFSAELRQLESQRSRLQAQVAAGQVSELDAQKQLLTLEQARIPQLTEIARLAVAAAQATGDPAKVQQAQELADAIAGLGNAASESTLMLRNMGQTIGGVLTNELTAFLSGGAEGFKSLKDAALDAVGSIIQALRRLLAQLLATKLIEFLGLGFSGGGKVSPSGGSDFETAGSFATGGRISSGRIFGPGTGTSDSVMAVIDGKRPARLSKDEHVMTAEVSNRPGHRQLFNAMNAGMSLHDLLAGGIAMPQLAPAPAVQRTSFAEGGAVGTTSSARIDGNVTIGLEDGLISRGIESKAGQEAILRVLSRRSRSARSALGGSF